jgi:hypothetical protein
MTTPEDISALRTRCASLGEPDVAALLAAQDPAPASLVLRELLPNVAQEILKNLPPVHARAILTARPPSCAKFSTRNSAASNPVWGKTSPLHPLERAGCR